ncbi:hypothetical protein Patl1_18101 [Pistacia atlantica]|uniref:Uncharacterized protein n=1 Tax=Pistacia atlantica TaxID=434234 RepID=A0ACC1C1X5_9ROSI|nr:hypothetical protein Patl1_18101 [Pistacia atlantica]
MVQNSKQVQVFSKKACYLVEMDGIGKMRAHQCSLDMKNIKNISYFIFLHQKALARSDVEAKKRRVEATII